MILGNHASGFIYTGTPGLGTKKKVPRASHRAQLKRMQLVPLMHLTLRNFHLTHAFLYAGISSIREYD